MHSRATNRTPPIPRTMPPPPSTKWTAILHLALLASACGGDAMDLEGSSEVTGQTESAIDLDISGQQVLGCDKVSANATVTLKAFVPSIQKTSSGDYGGVFCKRYVVDVNVERGVPAGYSPYFTIDGYGVDRPHLPLPFDACDSYREELTVYSKILGDFEKIGGGTRRGQSVALHIGPTGEIFPAHCALVESDSFQEIDPQHRCQPGEFCQKYRVAVRAYDVVTGVEQAVRVRVAHQ
ncbi:MAG TPA: hypothetical protein VFQ61_30900 [Polyangiaceae bacterium]|nr:hypothetical protein [Polyangiaceae bacterium]